jgi:hypothetical protein
LKCVVLLERIVSYWDVYVILLVLYCNVYIIVLEGLVYKLRSSWFSTNRTESKLDRTTIIIVIVIVIVIIMHHHVVAVLAQALLMKLQP